MSKVNVPPPPISKVPIIKNQSTKSVHGNIPCAVEIEQAILGVLLIDTKAYDVVRNLLKSRFFYNNQHKIIYQAIVSLANKNLDIDLLTVSQELSKKDQLVSVGGDFYLISMTQRVSSSAHIEYWTRIIIQKYILRKLIKNAENTIEHSYNSDPDVFEIMESIENEIADINKNIVQEVKGQESNAKEELFNKVKAVLAGESPGVYSGLYDFDEWCGGFQKRELITLAARPGMGKTTAVLAIAGNASFKKKIPVAFFSLEMAEADLKARLASRGTGIPYDKIRLGKLSQSELVKVLDYYDFIDNSSLYIVDKTTRLHTIKRKIEELILKHNIRMVIIDYVQLMKLSKTSGDRTSDLSTITRDLKALANEVNIPIIILAQLSRSVDDRPNKRPMLRDLKQSGSIEEDSDTVIFLLRNAYYEAAHGNSLPDNVVGATDMIIAKGRNTGTRDFKTFLDFKNYDFRSA